MILKILVNLNYILGLVKYLAMLFKSTDPEGARKLREDLKNAKQQAIEQKNPRLLADIINRKP